MSNQLANPSPNAAFMLPRPTVDERNRLQCYVDYLDRVGAHWSHDPDLAAYRDWLLQYGNKKSGYTRGLKASAVHAYLMTVRQRYKDLLTDNDVRAMLYNHLPSDLTPADKFAMVSERLITIGNAINPKKARVVVKKVQDKADSEQRRLTPKQALEVMSLPGLRTLRGVRNTAIITLMFCTGLRREEVCNLKIDDLYESLMGEPALKVDEGKGCKQRLVIYGEYKDWVLPACSLWLRRSNVSEGYLFRALLRPLGGKATANPMSVRTINEVFQSTGIEPHDTRRTYAKWLELSGMPIQEIKRQLGHESVDTTLLYIGDQDVTRRVPKSVLGNQ